MKQNEQLSFAKIKRINMKTELTRLIFFTGICFALCTTNLQSQSGSVGIGTTTPDTSAILDIQSTSKGVLIPRVTTSERIAISDPATGLMVFDSEVEGFYFYDGTSWRQASIPVDGAKDEVLKSDAAGVASWQSIFPAELYPQPDFSLETELNPVYGLMSVDLQGDYAYLASPTSKTLRVVDISDPTTPVEVGVDTLDIDLFAAAVVQESHAYVVNLDNEYLKVVDVSDPTSPDSVGVLALGNGSWSLDIQGDYVCTAVTSDAKIKIVNISDPTNPVLESSIDVPSSPRYIQMKGDYVFVTHDNSSGLTVIDISDPTMPNIASTLSLGPAPWFQAILGDYLYVLDLGDNKMRIVDISDPTLPAVISSITIGSFPSAIDVRGNYAYVVNDDSNDLKAVDISDPSAPVIIETISLGGSSFPRDINVKDNYAYIPDSGTGSFRVVKLSNAAPVGVDMTGGMATFSEVDGDPENELITGAILDGNNLEITDAGGTTQVDLSGIIPVETDPQVGSNTTNYLPKWDGTALASSSSVYEDGTGLGVGTTSPAVKLNVDGGSDLSPSSGGYFVSGDVSGINIAMDNNEIMCRNNGNTEPLYLNHEGGHVIMNGTNASGNVGIGESSPSHRLTVKSSDTETMRLMGSGTYGEFARLNFGDSDYVYIDEPTDDRMQIQASKVGIRREPITNEFEVEGQASKTTAGDWIANSDERLKKNIQRLDAETTLHKLLALEGITYEWDDDKTGSDRPEGTMYGFSAQNIQSVFPELVTEDKLGYLQTAYGTYDAMYVEAIRALKNENDKLKSETEQLKKRLEKLEAIILQSELSASVTKEE